MLQLPVMQHSQCNTILFISLPVEMALLPRTQHPDTLWSNKYVQLPVWHWPCRWWACRNRWCCFPGRTWSSPCTPPRLSALRCTRSQTHPVWETSRQTRDQRCLDTRNVPSWSAGLPTIQVFVLKRMGIGYSADKKLFTPLGSFYVLWY